MRCTQAQEEEQNKELHCNDKEFNSMLLKQETILSALEYARNKIVVSLDPTDLLIIENWQPKKIIFRMQPTNTSKYFIASFPNFDMKDFPFLVCSGSECFSLINVRDYKMQNLIHASCVNSRAQQAFFF